MDYRYCSKCGKFSKGKGNFCKFCGEKYDDIVLAPCISCGKEVEVNSNFCIYCGTEQVKLNDKEEICTFYPLKDEELTTLSKSTNVQASGNKTQTIKEQINESNDSRLNDNKYYNDTSDNSLTYDEFINKLKKIFEKLYTDRYLATTVAFADDYRVSISWLEAAVEEAKEYYAKNLHKDEHIFLIKSSKSEINRNPITKLFNNELYGGFILTDKYLYLESNENISRISIMDIKNFDVKFLTSKNEYIISVVYSENQTVKNSNILVLDSRLVILCEKLNDFLSVYKNNIYQIKKETALKKSEYEERIISDMRECFSELYNNEYITTFIRFPDDLNNFSELNLKAVIKAEKTYAINMSEDEHIFLVKISDAANNKNNVIKKLTSNINVGFLITDVNMYIEGNSDNKPIPLNEILKFETKFSKNKKEYVLYVNYYQDMRHNEAALMSMNSYAIELCEKLNKFVLIYKEHYQSLKFNK